MGRDPPRYPPRGPGLEKGQILNCIPFPQFLNIKDVVNPQHGVIKRILLFTFNFNAANFINWQETNKTMGGIERDYKNTIIL